MHSPFLAVLYHQWIRTRKLMLGGLMYSGGVLCLALLARRYQLGDFSSQEVLPCIHLAVQTGIIIALMCLAGTFSGEGLERFGVGRYLLTMPVRSSRCALALMAYAAIVVCVYAACITAVHVLSFGWELQGDWGKVRFSFWQVPATCVTAVVLVQGALLYSEAKNEFLIGLALLFAGGLALACGFSQFAPSGTRLYFVPLWIIALLAAYGLSHAGVLHGRCERGRRLGISTVYEWLDLFEGRTMPFRNPHEALQWFGWRRYSVTFLAFTIPPVLIALAAAVLAWFTAEWNSQEAGALVLGLPFGTVLAGAMIIGAVALQLHEMMATVRGENSFIFALPVRSAALGRACLYPQARALFFICAALAPPLLLTLRLGLASGQWQALFPLQAGAIILGMSLGAWIGMWFAMPLIYLYVPLLMLAAGDSWLISEEHARAFGSGLGAAVLLFCAAASVVLAVRRRCFDRQTLATTAAAWIFSLIVGSVVLAAMEPEARAFFIQHYILSFSVTLLGALPFVVAPVVIDWFRHGGGRWMMG